MLRICLCGDILSVRETPFNRIHMRNMTLAAEAGATIFPCIPAFYNHPASSEEMARQFVYRVLAQIGLPQLTRPCSQLIKRWFEGAL
jgi:3-polyprenyl-4-hydroxybenzoate decarboxylase